MPQLPHGHQPQLKARVSSSEAVQAVAARQQRRVVAPRQTRDAPSFRHHSRRDNRSSDTARVTVKKISFKPTSRRSSHALAGGAWAGTQRVCGADDQVAQVFGSHKARATQRRKISRSSAFALF